MCDYLKTKLHAPNTMMLSLDEYGSRMRPGSKYWLGMQGRENAMNFLGLEKFSNYVHHDPDDWSTRRFPPQHYEMVHAIANASVALTMLRHADRVKIGCATGGLGQLCATNREHVWKSMSYYPMTHLIRYGQGTSLITLTECEKYDVDGYAIDDMNQYTGFDNVDYIQTAAAMNEEKGEMTVFVISADPVQKQAFTLDVRGFEGWQFREHISMSAADPKHDRNSYEQPDTVLPVSVPGTKADHGMVSAVLEPLSWNVFRFTLR